MGRRKLQILVLTTVIALLAGLFYLALASRPRLYEGKPLTQWIDECSVLRLTNDFVTTQTWGPRIRGFGPSVVPELVNLLEEKHPWKEKLYNFIFRRNLKNQWAADLKQRARLEAERPATAAFFLYHLGPAGEPAIPALLRSLDGTNIFVRGNALNALGGIHQRSDLVVPLLTNLLTNNNEAIFAAFAIRHFGSNAAPALPALRSYAIRSTGIGQAHAMQTLCQLAPDSNADIIVPYCLKILQDTNSSDRYACIPMLWSLGPRARDAVPALTSLANHDDYLSQPAAYALKAIDPEAAKKLWPTLWRPIAPNPATYYNLIETRQDFVKRIHTMGPQAFSYLSNAVANGPVSGNSSSEASYAAYALGEMGTAGRAAIPVLTRAIANPQSYIYPVATAALMKIKGEPISPLFEQVKNTADWVSWQFYIKVVAEFESKAEPAIPIIIDAMNGAGLNENIRTFGAIALGRIQRRPDLSVPALIPLLDSTSASTRSSAMDALLAFGPDAKPALPKVIEALDDLDPYVRHSATNLLKILDPSALTKLGAK